MFACQVQDLLNFLVILLLCSSLDLLYVAVRLSPLSVYDEAFGFHFCPVFLCQVFVSRWSKSVVSVPVFFRLLKGLLDDFAFKGRFFSVQFQVTMFMKLNGDGISAHLRSLAGLSLPDGR